MKKLLSIIVPSYNMEKYLPKCLGSLIVDDPELLQQLDVIVVNDGSKDRTSEIAHEFEAKYPGVFRVIDKENGHYGSCVNAALPVAVGKYVRILDADDYVLTDGLAGLLKVLDRCDADLVWMPFREVDDDGTLLRHKKLPGDFPEGPAPLTVLDKTFFAALHAIVYRRALFDGGWYRQVEGICYTDCQWCSEPMLRVHSVYVHTEEVTCYRLGRAGQSMETENLVRLVGQLMRVMEYLLTVLANGQPTFSNVITWNYFRRFCVERVSVIYSISFKGVQGKFPPLDKILIFQDEIKGTPEILAALNCRVDVLGWTVDFVHDSQYMPKWCFQMEVYMVRVLFRVRYLLNQLFDLLKKSS